MRAVDLAVWADALAGESASLTARAERTRTRIAQAGLERAARAELEPATVAALDRLGLLGRLDVVGARAELRDLECGLAAVEALQAWVEGRLARAATM